MCPTCVQPGPPASCDIFQIDDITPESSIRSPFSSLCPLTHSERINGRAAPTATASLPLPTPPPPQQPTSTSISHKSGKAPRGPESVLITHDTRPPVRSSPPRRTEPARLVTGAFRFDLPPADEPTCEKRAEINSASFNYVYLCSRLTRRLFKKKTRSIIRALARPHASTTASHDPACAPRQRDAIVATWPNTPTLSGRFTRRWRGYVPHTRRADR